MQARSDAAKRAARHYEALTSPRERVRLKVGRRDASYAYRVAGIRGIVISPVTCRDATDAELRGELRHEQAHLAERWPVPSLLLLSAGVALAVPLVAVGPGTTRSGGWSIAIAVLPLVAFAALCVAARLKRGREYAADARAARTDAGHHDMVAMLRRLERLWPTPAQRPWMTRLMATHPTGPERLARLAALRRGSEPPSREAATGQVLVIE